LKWEIAEKADNFGNSLKIAELASQLRTELPKQTLAKNGFPKKKLICLNLKLKFLTMSFSPNSKFKICQTSIDLNKTVF
jgi:hypothetical protein